MKEETIITTCPYCGADASQEKLLVILGGKVYRQCAECKTEPITILGYLFGTLFYDVPMMVFALVVILFAHFMFSPYTVGNTAEVVVILKVVIYGMMSIVFPLGMWWISGLPFFLTLIIMPLFSAWMIFG